MAANDQRAEVIGSEREALQMVELMLRPGPGQCEDATVAHTVVRSFLDRLDIDALPEAL